VKPSVNLKLYDRAVSHQIGITRYSTSAVKQAVGVFNRQTVPAIINALAAHDPIGSAQIASTIDHIHSVIDANDDDVQASIKEHISDLISHEIEHTVAALKAALPVPIIHGIKAFHIKARTPLIITPDVPPPKKPVRVDPETEGIDEVPLVPIDRSLQFGLILGTPSDRQAEAALNARPFEGQVMSEHLNDLPDATFNTVKKTISQGYANGLTTDQIISQLRGTRANNFSDGVLQQSRNSIERTTRTALNFTANVARDSVYQQNSDIVDSVRWVSTLDTRTSDICIALDGQVFPVDSGPRPPAHYNCRSATSPITKSWSELGFDATDLPDATRASMDGQVPATETYGTWLARQTDSVQDDVLGPTRAALFRDGGLSVDKFVDTAGRSLTIDQLRTREASAFQDAGL
jgi:SPP1 gp7 family putative phage head morphogenesis protein